VILPVPAGQPLSATPAPTLEDSIAEGLDVLFVGINPAIYSVERGHYFARRANKFWPCLSRSALSRRAREALGVAVLGPEHDRAILEYGIGFTDVVKRPTAKASDLDRAELAAGVPHLLKKIRRFRPRVACFHGVTGYRHVHEAMGLGSNRIALGLQDLTIGDTRVFLVPNPSGANAHFSRADQVFWYDQVAPIVARRLRPAGRARCSAGRA
jgi:TDG/mug DNA glycosylase family protein